MAYQRLGAPGFRVRADAQASLRGTLSGSDLDGVMHFLCANANLRLIFFLWRPFLPDSKDDFVLELAVESRADFVITFNTRDFAGAERFGVRVISPREFPAIIGEAP